MRLFISAITLIFTLGIYAQDYSKHYVMNTCDKYRIYYTYSKYMDKNCKGVKDLDYDFTYVDTDDYISMLATCSSLDYTKVDSMLIILPNMECGKFALENLYYEKKNKYWNNRFKCIIPYDFFMKMYENESAYTLRLEAGNSVSLEFKDKPKKWEKRRDTYRFVQTIININRK